MLGMHGTAFANYAVEDCDFLIAVGSRFDDRVAGKCRRSSRRSAKHIAHLDIDASEIGKVKHVDWATSASSPAALRAAARVRAGARLQDATSALAPTRRGAASSRYAMNYDRDSPLIQPYYVLEEINQITQGEAIVTTGVGQHQMWAAQYLDFRAAAPVAHLRQHGHDGLRPAGGDRRADRQPGTLVIDVDGDGSIRMNLGELETLTTYDIPVKVLLLNNLGDGMVASGRSSSTRAAIRHRQDAAQEGLRQGRAGRRLRLRAAARPQGRRARVVEEFVAFAGPGVPRGDGSTRTPASTRWSGPGMGYKDMITGDFIGRAQGRHEDARRNRHVLRRGGRHLPAASAASMRAAKSA